MFISAKVCVHIEVELCQLSVSVFQQREFWRRRDLNLDRTALRLMIEVLQRLTACDEPPLQKKARVTILLHKKERQVNRVMLYLDIPPASFRFCYFLAPPSRGATRWKIEVSSTSVGSRARWVTCRC